MDIHRDTGPWTVYGHTGAQERPLHTFRSRRDSIAWVHAHQYIHPIMDDGGFYIHDSITVRRSDIHPSMHTPYDAMIIHGYAILHKEGESLYTPQGNTAPLDTIVRPIMVDINVGSKYPDKTSAVYIKWHHPLPSIFPFSLSLRRIYTQTITPSTITLTSYTGTIDAMTGWGDTRNDISDRDELLDLLHRTLMKHDTISAHERMQCMRQLPRIIDPDICNIIGAHYTLD